MAANAIQHGNRQDPTKKIWLDCLWHRCFYLMATDEGPGFDIKDPPFIQGRSGMPPEGGLGLEVIKLKSNFVYNDHSSVISVFKK